MIRYEVIIYWSQEDEVFVAEVPELPGCMADGQTYEEALASAQTVILEWIDTARELGRPIPEPKGRLIYAWCGGSENRCICHSEPERSGGEESPRRCGRRPSRRDASLRSA